MSCKLCDKIFDIKQNLRDQFTEEHPAEKTILAQDYKKGRTDLMIRFHKDPPTYAVGVKDISYCPKCGRRLFG